MKPEEVRLQQLEQRAEESYGAMYGAHDFTTAAAHYSDVKEYLCAAIGLARRLGREDDAVRLEGRLEQIRAVYRSQMS
jgi:hypothetical protein